MVVRLLERRGRHDGPLLPRLPTRRTAEGTLLTAARAGGRDLIWPIVAVGISILLIVIAAVVPLKLSKLLDVLFYVVLALTTFIGAIEVYLVKRRLLHATILVNRWPLRLGDNVEVRFRATLRKPAPDAVLTANLSCAEEATSGYGRDKRLSRGSLYQIDLESTSRVIDGRKLSHTWQVAIPVEFPPSFHAPSNSVHWLLRTMITTGHVEVPAVFEFLVLPEVVE